jgi:hypothetical protein
LYLAHSGGRIQLFVEHLGLHATGGNDWAVSVQMIDADSGAPAAGFDVIAEATDKSGHSAGPVTLTDKGAGQYAGPVTVAPAGQWEFAIRAETLPGGPPGVPLRKVYPVVIEPGRDVALGGKAPGGSGMNMAVPVGSAVATVAIVAWFIVARRRRPGLAPARRTGAL